MFDTTQDYSNGARQAAIDIDTFHGNLEASVNPYTAQILNSLLNSAVSNLIGAITLGTTKHVNYWTGYVGEIQYVLNEYDFNSINTVDRKVVPTLPQ